MEKQYRKIDLPRTKGSPFFMAFCYLPKEVLVLTGSLDSIRGYCEKAYKICHAQVVNYRRGIKLGQTSFILLGEATTLYRLYKVHPKKKPLFNFLKTKRRGWVITGPGGMNRFYRRLPKEFLDIFKGIKEEEASTRYTLLK